MTALPQGQSVSPRRRGTNGSDLRLAALNTLYAPLRVIYVTAAPLQQHIDPMDQHPDQPADQRPVDADILQIVANRIFQPVGDGLRIPAADRVRHQPQRRLAIAVDRADGRAARIAVAWVL